MKTALITGASKGIGAQTARLLAQKGYAVAINWNTSRQAAEQLVFEIRRQNGVAMAVQADVSQAAEVNRMTETVRQQLGKIRLLVNNAAIAESRLFSEISENSWDRMFAVNVKGAYLCAKAVLPDMIQAQSGCIVNVSSIWGITGASCEVHYSAAKAALIGMTKALAKELGPSGITVNCVAPGIVHTDMNAQHSPEILSALAEETPLGRLGLPEDVAEAIAFLASPAAGFITGQVLSPNGGFVI